VAIQPDGKLLVAGIGSVAGQLGVVVKRYLG
jgi:hypothetical protein